MIARTVIIGLAAAGFLALSVYADWGDSPGVDPVSISLNGDNPLYLEIGDTFADPGATCLDNGVSTTVYATGSVDTSTAGTHTLTYECSLSGPSKNRIVVVNPANTAPDMTLSSHTYTYSGGGIPSASLLGPSCSDAEDGDLSNTSVTWSYTQEEDYGGNAVRIFYTFTYICTDSGGLTDTATGTIWITR